MPSQEVRKMTQVAKCCLFLFPIYIGVISVVQANPMVGGSQSAVCAMMAPFAKLEQIAIKIPAKKVVKFRAGKSLKDTIK
jgi:hypothetical protein